MGVPIKPQPNNVMFMGNGCALCEKAQLSRKVTSPPLFEGQAELIFSANILSMGWGRVCDRRPSDVTTTKTDTHGRSAGH